MSPTHKRITPRLVRNAVRDALDVFLHYLPAMTRRTKFPSVAVLFLYADQGRYPHAKSDLQDVFRWHKAIDLNFISIDNFNPDKKPSIDEYGAHDIGGDNTWWEFSGWRKGLQYLTETLQIHPDVVVCVNDAFLNRADQGRDKRHFRRAFSPAILVEAKSAVLGTLFETDPPCEFDGEDVSPWIQTNFFAMPFDFARAHLGSALTEAQVKELFDETWSGRIFKPNTLCNPALEDLLSTWITNNWDRASAPNADNWPFLRMKLVAILNERLLCLAARKAGLGLGDVSRIRCWQPPKVERRS